MLKDGELKFFKNRVSCHNVSPMKVMLGYVKHLWRGLKHKNLTVQKNETRSKQKQPKTSEDTTG